MVKRKTYYFSKPNERLYRVCGKFGEWDFSTVRVQTVLRVHTFLRVQACLGAQTCLRMQTLLRVQTFLRMPLFESAHIVESAKLLRVQTCLKVQTFVRMQALLSVQTYTDHIRIIYGSYTGHIRLIYGSYTSYATSYKLCYRFVTYYVAHMCLKLNSSVVGFCQESLKLLNPPIFVTPN